MCVCHMVYVPPRFSVKICIEHLICFMCINMCDLRLPPGLQYEVRPWTLKMGRIYGPETLVKNQRKATLGNNPKFITSCINVFNVGYAVTQLVGALRYRPEGFGFNSRWGHWTFSVN
jgi:hypothetical protein